jgi:hypothetical protein
MLTPDVWVPLVVGMSFTTLALLKLYGLAHGIVGGARVSFKRRLCGT